MKRVLFSLALVYLSVLVFGCAGTGIRPPEPHYPYLMVLFEGQVVEKITQALKTSSFMKGRPFIIVKTDGEVVSAEIDTLTAELREQLVSELLAHREIRLVRRHFARAIDRPYTLKELDCDRYVEPEMLLTIDVKGLDTPSGNAARINVRAIDRREKDTWVRGFSIHEKILLVLKSSD